MGNRAIELPFPGRLQGVAIGSLGFFVSHGQRQVGANLFQIVGLTSHAVIGEIIPDLIGNTQRLTVGMQRASHPFVQVQPCEDRPHLKGHFKRWCSLASKNFQHFHWFHGVWIPHPAKLRSLSAA